DRGRLLFETALQSSALDGRDAIGLNKVKEEKLGELRLHELNAPAEAPAGARGGFGGKAAGSPKMPAAAEAVPPPAKKSPPKRGEAEPDKNSDDLDDGRYRDGASRRKTGKEADEKDYYYVLERDRLGRRQLYRRLEATQELAENNYYHLPIQQQLAGLVGVSEFWLDYAKYQGKGPFLSRHVADASRNFTEIMFALAVLDLPFKAAKHDVKFDGGKMTFTPAGTVLAFHEEVRPAAPAAAKVQILVSQNFYRHGDRFREENGERFDKFITNEFVVHTVYGCQVVVTNPSPSKQRLAVLLQLPVGSLPLANAQSTKSVQIDLEPYHTQTLDYFFYFPKSGRFNHFPVHVAKNEALVASAEPFVFNVVDKPSKLDTESWEYVSQDGTAEQVVQFLNRENVHALDLTKIAFRMKDKDFFQTVTQLLQERHAYQPTLWSYALLHNVVPAAREFLLHTDQIVTECGGPIAGPLLTVDPVARHMYEHLEYKPLVNARAHSLGPQRQIVNARVLEQYQRFMKLLGYRKQMSDDDKLAVTYYLVLQDRIEEALATFAEVHSEGLTTKVQYDYCQAYLDLFSVEPTKARGIVAKYAAHPVDRWRNAFASIANQLDEAEGKGPKIADVDDRTQRQGSLAASEPAFEFTLDAQTINLSWQNIDSVRVNYYLMDVELLFSRNPFVQQSGGRFSSIRPNSTRELKLPSGERKLAVKLPDDLAHENVLVEVVAAGKTRALRYYASVMDVRMMENYGQLRVADQATGKPLPKVYVKTYVRLANGQVKFHKDGYTDLRGRFDYASVSTLENVAPDRYSILVMSEEHGATIREVAPPQR
ncbi:MAG TPA: hypothetical protein VKE94_09035, partial [Gemmataceae bacterium]|nr:hypothetical protein [Gemmataceae bacterium]